MKKAKFHSWVAVSTIIAIATMAALATGGCQSDYPYWLYDPTVSPGEAASRNFPDPVTE